MSEKIVSEKIVNNNSKLQRSQIREASALFTTYKRQIHPQMKKFLEPSDHIDKQQLIIEAAMESITDAEIKLTEVILANPSAIFMIVGTNPKISSAVKEVFIDTPDLMITHRWVGGLLTNFQVVSQQQQTLKKMRIFESNGGDKAFGNKARMVFQKSKNRLEKTWSNLLHFRKQPDFMIVINPRHEQTAISEAKKLGIPIFAISKTNINPDQFISTTVINDSSASAVKFLLERWKNLINFERASALSKLNQNDQ